MTHIMYTISVGTFVKRFIGALHVRAHHKLGDMILKKFLARAHFLMHRVLNRKKNFLDAHLLQPSLI